ncbi:acylamino-acid-releasing enzyme [Oceanobacillus iheyensis HTE831]|uniref:Acylamino-acid-releasing enzyme n=1 Tax=Oceanobacillus iheyensis (strain DSM 14371 / CIP 107618 / JCM 11309 / KCTC 3954 / HTE831) TaxID=221109 RepID=Q8ET03_OCEIH|nr:S9 family peptidase [Oceanobacillus iheyensis]BAC12418.1 acylamino-acid-releasing enzyme [Oceanobacillus iheyensis HTE831]
MSKKQDVNKLLSFLNAKGAYQPRKIGESTDFTFLANLTGRPQVWKIDEKGKVSAFHELKDRVLQVYHSPSGKHTVLASDFEGNEKQQFYLSSDNGKTIEDLVISPEHFHQFGGWSPDESKITYASNRRDPGYFDIFTLNIKTKEEVTVFESNTNCTPLTWTADGKGIIFTYAVSNIDNQLHILDLESGKTKPIGNVNVPARYHSVQLTKDNLSGYVVTDEGRDTLAIAKFHLEKPDSLEFIYKSEQWDIEEVKVSADEKHLAFSLNEGGSSQLGIYSVDKNKVKFTKSLPVGVYQSIQWLNERALLIGVTSSILPGDIWKVDIVENESERLTNIGESPEVDHLWVEPEVCHFSSFDGLEVPYFLYGKKSTNQPVMIYVHGGPESQIRNEYNPVIQYLAAQGYAVAAPNVRGSMGYGREYVQLDDIRKRMDAVADLNYLVEDLVSTHQTDRNRVGIMGRSYGGFMVLAAITHYPTVWAAAVDIVGISHFRTFLENTGPWRRRLREQEYGSLEHDSDFFEEIAPLNHTEKIQVPLLIFHGKNDTRVPVSEAEQLTKDLESQGKDVELIIFEDEGHQTEKLENHVVMNKKTVEFMDQWLGE